MKIGDKVRVTHTKWAGCEGILTSQHNNGNFKVRITKHNGNEDVSSYEQTWGERDLELISPSTPTIELGDKELEERASYWSRFFDGSR